MKRTNSFSDPRDLESRWADIAEDYEDDVYVVDDHEAPPPMDEPPREAGVLNFEATPLQMRMGRWASFWAVFFYRFWWIPGFSPLGRWCSKRAFWFAGGGIPVRTQSGQRDADYQHRRAMR